MLKALAMVTVLLLGGCGGGDGAALIDAIGAATGDGGKRVILTGSIMGVRQSICVDSPPAITPAALQAEVDKYLRKSIRWDSGTSIDKKIEDNRSCKYKLDPYLTIAWDQFVADSANKQLADWGRFSANISGQGQRSVKVCMRDNECEDGDILAITLAGKEIARAELTNAGTCFDVPVNSGVNYLGVYAVNGTGFRGQCSFEDRNTGEVTVTGASGTGGKQLYSVRGGQGSYGALTIEN